MKSSAKLRFSRFLMLFSTCVFAVAAIQMIRHQEPFHTWFYSFAWWSYILFLQAFLYHQSGSSPLFDSPGGFLILLPLSVTIWLIFEAFNFRLQNWHYYNVPSLRSLRWGGYAISFATVLPGIFSTTQILEHFKLLEKSRIRPLREAVARYNLLIGLGAACLILPLLWPKFFFALVWGGFIFLLEPVNHRLGFDSLLKEWENGSLRRFYLLLISGLVCGLLWEFWNFWAGSKWVYTVPFVGEFKIFEMPVLGFLGFPPFAVECYAMTSFLTGLLTSRRRITGIITAFSIVIFDLLVFYGIDRFTVISFVD